MTNDEVKIKIIRDNQLYSEEEISHFKYDKLGIPLKTYTDWLSKGYTVYEDAEGYETTIWLKKKKGEFHKKKVTLYSGHQVYKEQEVDEMETEVWRDIENPDEAWENIGRDRYV